MTNLNRLENYGGRLFRPTDVAVLNDVAQLEWNGVRIPTVLASPSRAAAAFIKMLCLKENDAIPLPRIAVSRTGTSLDQPRFNMHNHREMRWSDDRRARQVGRHPTPYNMEYQINFWDKQRGRLTELVEMYLDRFDPTYRITIDFGSVWGKAICNTTLSSVEDASELEPGEDADRKLRMNVSISVESWLLKEARYKPVTTEITTVIDTAGEIETYTHSVDGG